MIISMIAAMAHDRVIGKDNQMPWHLPADLAHFKRVTLGKPVLMGRKTYQSIGRPLPGRVNIVISRDPDFRPEGVVVCDSIEAALAQAESLGSNEVMVMGGGHIYAQCLSFAQRLYLTYIDATIEGDTQFPDYQQYDWQEREREAYPADSRNPYSMSFVTLERC